jgi:hypothetical protein
MSLKRKIHRKRTQHMTKVARALHKRGLSFTDMHRQARDAQAHADACNARAAKSKYPCDVCGRESKYYRKWSTLDPRRRQFPFKQRMDGTMADTWCWRHAPISMWSRPRRWTYIAVTALLHPIRFVQVVRAGRERKRVMTTIIHGRPQP